MDRAVLGVITGGVGFLLGLMIAMLCGSSVAEIRAERDAAIAKVASLKAQLAAVTCDSAPETNTPAPKREMRRMVRVAVNDDTNGVPVDPKAEIWFRGCGSWWLKPELKFGGTFKDLGSRTVDVKHTLIFYPNGRNGRELQVPYMLTADMGITGNPRDMISVDMSDENIKVMGQPIREATSEFTLTYPR